MSDYDWVYLFL